MFFLRFMEQFMFRPIRYLTLLRAVKGMLIISPAFTHTADCHFQRSATAFLANLLTAISATASLANFVGAVTYFAQYNCSVYTLYTL